MNTIGLVTWGRGEKAHDEEDAAPDGEYPEYLIGEIVDHDPIPSKRPVRYHDARKDYPEEYRLAQDRPNHEAVLYLRQAAKLAVLWMAGRR